MSATYSESHFVARVEVLLFSDSVQLQIIDTERYDGVIRFAFSILGGSLSLA